MKETIRIFDADTFTKSFFTILFIVFAVNTNQAQERDLKVNQGWNDEKQKHTWYASWIGYPLDNPESYRKSTYPYHTDYGVYMFRNTFILEEKPADFQIHVSADNRYRLYVNEKEVLMGPATGDLRNWYYETIDISRWLIKGENIIAAEVVNFGPERPLAMLSHQTALILQADKKKNHNINTGSGGWKVLKNTAYQPIPNDYGAYIEVGPTDKMNGKLFPWGWHTLNFIDSTWLEPRVITKGKGKGYMSQTPWVLIPRDIPFMHHEKEEPLKIRRVQTNSQSPGTLMNGFPLHVNSNENVSVLLDMGYLTIGYPELKYSGGENGTIKITYAESLFDESGLKGNRDSIEDKQIYGYYDVIQADGGTDREFKPLWLRTFRYIQLDIQTFAEPLVIENIKQFFSGYPLKLQATFQSNNKLHDRIWDVSWRTMRNCSGEIMYDCPYYEQMQYIGDAKMNAHFSYLLSRDDRLARKFLKFMHHSMLPLGLTQSRYPSNALQVIPPFSLIWINALHDFMMYRDDSTFLYQFLPDIERILTHFENKIAQNNMIHNTEYWNFGDWTTDWKMGIPPGADSGYSAFISLQAVYGFQQAAGLYRYFDMHHEASEAEKIADILKTGVMENCYNKKRRLIADTPGKNTFSQQTNILGILTNTLPVNEFSNVMDTIMNKSDITEASIAFSYYYFMSLKKTGKGEFLKDKLDTWEDMLQMGLTTFPETNIEDNPRSDCHVWSSSPFLAFLSLVAGIESAAPGFKEVEIAPRPGTLENVAATIPHPRGKIKVDLKFEGSRVIGIVELPDNIKGTFRWGEHQVSLIGGKKEIELNK